MTAQGHPRVQKGAPESLYDGPKAPKVAIRSHFGASLEAPGLKTIKNTSVFACFHVAPKVHPGRIFGDPGMPQAPQKPAQWLQKPP